MSSLQYHTRWSPSGRETRIDLRYVDVIFGVSPEAFVFSYKENMSARFVGLRVIVTGVKERSSILNKINVFESRRCYNCETRVSCVSL